MSSLRRLRQSILQSRYKFLALAAAHLTTEAKAFAIDLRHRGAATKASRGQTGLKLNIGCGAKTLAGWTNIDLHPAADYRLDLRQALPFESGCAERVYCEHFLEHLDYPIGAERFLRECFRVLASGGRVELSVPDTEEPLRAYRSEAQSAYFDSEELKAWHDDWCRTPLEHLNYHFRQSGLGRPPFHPEYHHFAYDYETLAAALQRRGFVSVAWRDFDPTLDSKDRRNGSLRVSALKP